MGGDADASARVRLEPSWKARIGEQLMRPRMRELSAFLRQRQAAGAHVYPPGPQIFAAFDATPFEQVKVVILGQDPYHGPGQVVIYLLLDLNRRGLKVRELVTAIEQAVIDFLATHGVAAMRREGAPGVYVGDAKIAALGLKIKNGCSYHGLSLNVDMDLSPFTAINPCGYAGLEMVQMAELVSPTPEFNQVADILADHLQQQLTVEEAHP